MPTTPKIVTRSETTSSNSTQNLNKGSKLTFAEMDSNFIELRNGSIGVVGDDSTGIDIAHGSTLNVAGAGGIATAVSGDTLTIDGSNLSSLGDLTAIGSTLVSPSNAAITLDPSGTGTIELNANTNVTGTLGVTGASTLDGVTISDNTISTNASNANLEISGNGVGHVDLKGNGTRIHTENTADAETPFEVLKKGSQSAHFKIVTDNNSTDADIIFNTGARYVSIEGSSSTLVGSIHAAIGSTGNIKFKTLGGNELVMHDMSGNVQGVKITDNTISTSASNEDLEISANGSGTIVLENLSIAGDGATVTGILDEDAMGSNSAVKLATQQSIKAYVDANTLNLIDEDDMASDSETRPPSQQSVKAYVDAEVVGAGSGFKIVGDDSAGVDIAGGGSLYVQGGTNITTSTDSAGVLTINGGGAVTSLITDGLTIIDNNITGTRSNEDIRITASGSGDVIIDTDILKVGSGGEAASIHSNGDNELRLIGGLNAQLTITGNDSAAGASAVISNQQYNIFGTGSSQAKLTSRGDQPLRLMTDSGNGTAYLSVINDSGVQVTGTLSATGAITGNGALSVTGASTMGGISIEDHTIKTNSSNANMFIEASGTGTIQLENLSVAGDGATVTGIKDEDDMASNSATKLATQQSIKAYVDSQSGGAANTGDITFVGSTMISPSNADITLNPAGTGKVNINAVYTLPNADGSANQVLGTNGSGVLSFVDPTAINIDGGVADTTYTSVPTIDGGTA